MPIEPVKMLIVEDNAATVKLLANLMTTNFGATTLRIESVGTVSDAVASILRTPPDVVLLDLMLPDARDGMDTLNRIGDLVCPAQIVPVSGYLDENLALQAVALGTGGVVHKDATHYETTLVQLVTAAIQVSRRMRMAGEKYTEQIEAILAILRDLQHAATSITEHLSRMDSRVTAIEHELHGTPDEPGIAPRMRKYEQNARWILTSGITIGISVGGAVSTMIFKLLGK